MISRYVRPLMRELWSDENKYRIMTEIEVLACEAMAKLGKIPRRDAEVIRKKASFNIERIKEIEKRVDHDTIAFVTNLSENVGPAGRFIHKGLTSYDIVDTGLSVMLRDSMRILMEDARCLMRALAEKAVKYRNAVMPGRTHGVHAEPTTFGLKMALFHDEMKRNLLRLEAAKETISYGKLSGAVGTFAHNVPFVEEYVCKKLGLKPAPVSTQILQRDRHAECLCAIAIAGASVEKIAVEIRNLQRTEIQEVEESFGRTQKGSSAMPHKKNPWHSERVAGLARILRGNAMAALENVALWHERDLTNSSVERVILPDSTQLLDFMLVEMTRIIKDLFVNVDRMRINLEVTKGMIFSQPVMLALIDAGMSREDAYRVVQENARAAQKSGSTFLECLCSDRRVTKLLGRKELAKALDAREQLRNVDYIMKRAKLRLKDSA